MKELEEKRLAAIATFLDEHRYHAGEWHEADCDFPDVDAAVCNCDYTKLEKEFDALLLESMRLARRGGLEGLLAKSESCQTAQEIRHLIKEELLN